MLCASRPSQLERPESPQQRQLPIRTNRYPQKKIGRQEATTQRPAVLAVWKPHGMPIQRLPPKAPWPPEAGMKPPDANNESLPAGTTRLRRCSPRKRIRWNDRRRMSAPRPRQPMPGMRQATAERSGSGMPSPHNMQAPVIDKSKLEFLLIAPDRAFYKTSLFLFFLLCLFFGVGNLHFAAVT